MDDLVSPLDLRLFHKVCRNMNQPTYSKRKHKFDSRKKKFKTSYLNRIRQSNKFKSNNSELSQTKSQTTMEILICPICRKESLSLDIFVQHMGLHLNQETSTAPRDGKVELNWKSWLFGQSKLPNFNVPRSTYQDSTSLCDMSTNRFSKLEVQQKKSIKGAVRFQCTLCGDKPEFGNIDAFLVHIESQHQYCSYKCTCCNKRFTVREACLKHILQVHLNYELDETFQMNSPYPPKLNLPKQDKPQTLDNMCPNGLDLNGVLSDPNKLSEQSMRLSSTRTHTPDAINLTDACYTNNHGRTLHSPAFNSWNLYSNNTFQNTSAILEFLKILLLCNNIKGNLFNSSSLMGKSKSSLNSEEDHNGDAGSKPWEDKSTEPPKSSAEDSKQDSSNIPTATSTPTVTAAFATTTANISDCQISRTNSTTMPIIPSSKETIGDSIHLFQTNLISEGQISQFSTRTLTDPNHNQMHQTSPIESDKPSDVNHLTDSNPTENYLLFLRSHPVLSLLPVEMAAKVDTNKADKICHICLKEFDDEMAVLRHQVEVHSLNDEDQKPQL